MVSLFSSPFSRLLTATVVVPRRGFAVIVELVGFLAARSYDEEKGRHVGTRFFLVWKHFPQSPALSLGSPMSQGCDYRWPIPPLNLTMRMKNVKYDQYFEISRHLPEILSTQNIFPASH
ncbi:hypothetical protein M413DRAFT_33008 [Hebeloma cylindrosporum]|uniref:Uncharacterized protein n=1 Tax=Hebeloma cylindrosporum TaxID=76867 RepID=A0A0C3BDB5_HEBCY|nr:hypothetical protein M413DRAFT_33008 [Hebeloma cylindrosporum h7]